MCQAAAEARGRKLGLATVDRALVKEENICPDHLPIWKQGGLRLVWEWSAEPKKD